VPAASLVFLKNDFLVLSIPHSTSALLVSIRTQACRASTSAFLGCRLFV
jgi:hypothetical protein